MSNRGQREKRHALLEHRPFFRVSRIVLIGETAMDWNRVEGNWKEVKGKVKEKWAKLTDDDLTAINGQRDQLEGRLQKRYGYAKDQAKKDVDTWFSSLK
jgi:uncharacterized protein YjbJ (UPF0337 family)